MKNAFVGLTGTLNMAEERISKIEAISIETGKNEHERTKRKKESLNKIPEYPRTVKQLQKLSHMYNENSRRNI